MKCIPSFRLEARLCAALLVPLLAPLGCTCPQVIFDGVALVRTTGQIVVAHELAAVAALKPVLSLNATEMELLRRIAAQREQARKTTTAGIRAADDGKPYCLTGTGNPPTCYGMNDCKSCKVVAIGVDASGNIGDPVEIYDGSSITFSAPYSYYCECTHKQ